MINYKLKVKKETTGEGIITGYANVFNIRDHAYDITTADTFTNTMSKWEDNFKQEKFLPLIFDHEHEAQKVIGHIYKLVADDYGLYFEAKINLNVPNGKTAFELMKAGDVSSFSIGYLTIQESWIENYDDYMKSYNSLIEVDLMEVSLVLFPCSEGSDLLSIKNNKNGVSNIMKTNQKLALSKAIALAVNAPHINNAFSKLSTIDKKALTIGGVDGAALSLVQLIDSEVIKRASAIKGSMYAQLLESATQVPDGLMPYTTLIKITEAQYIRASEIMPPETFTQTPTGTYAKSTPKQEQHTSYAWVSSEALKDPAISLSDDLLDDLARQAVELYGESLVVGDGTEINKFRSLESRVDIVESLKPHNERNHEIFMAHKSTLLQYSDLSEVQELLPCTIASHPDLYWYMNTTTYNLLKREERLSGSDTGRLKLQNINVMLDDNIKSDVSGNVVAYLGVLPLAIRIQLESNTIKVNPFQNDGGSMFENTTRASEKMLDNTALVALIA